MLIKKFALTAASILLLSGYKTAKPTQHFQLPQSHPLYFIPDEDMPMMTHALPFVWDEDMPPVPHFLDFIWDEDMPETAKDTLYVGGATLVRVHPDSDVYKALTP